MVAEDAALLKKAAKQLKIKLGNDAMQTPEDVVRALATDVAHQLRDLADFDSQPGREIRDANGNTVGGWHITGRA